MPLIDVTQDFAFAEKGIYVTEYTKGQQADVSDECAECAIREKWAKPSRVQTPAPTAAPENLAFESAPEVK